MKSTNQQYRYSFPKKAINGMGRIPKEYFRIVGRHKRAKVIAPENSIETLMFAGATRQEAEYVVDYIYNKPAKKLVLPNTLIYSIPDEVFSQSVGQYEANQLAYLLRQHFGFGIADELLQRFQIGTSDHWPGACVFWYIDEYGNKRGGQIKLFGKDWHTIKYIDQEGKKRSKTSWIHSALIRRCKQHQSPIPAWLSDYDTHAECSPCLFGLPQITAAPIDSPIAIVEAPQTAIICSYYFPAFVWLAVGALSYLNADRLAPLRGRKVMLFPNLSKPQPGKPSAFDQWSRIANELNRAGFQISVSDLLEKIATDTDKVQGLDLADYLLRDWKGYPPDWDEPSPPDAKPTIILNSFRK